MSDLKDNNLDLKDLISKSKKKNKISYGFEKGSDVRATNILINEKGSFFDINIKKTNLLRKETIKKVQLNILGKHKGIANYTIGQRKGLGIGGNNIPLYVIDIEKDKNLIVLGPEENLKKNKVKFNKINWLDSSIKPKNLVCHAKIRSTQKAEFGILNIEKKEGEFLFDNHLNATSPGQACVFYLGDQLLGGGWIAK